MEKFPRSAFSSLNKFSLGGSYRREVAAPNYMSEILGTIPVKMHLNTFAVS
jgi:hypothetical protein